METGEVTSDPELIDMEAIPVHAANLVFRKTKRDLRMAFDSSTGVMYEFNDTGSSFLGEIDGSKSFREIATALAEAYDADVNDILSDLKSLIARMIDADIIKLKKG